MNSPCVTPREWLVIIESSFSCQSVSLNCYTIPNGGLEMVEGGIGFYYWH